MTSYRRPRRQADLIHYVAHAALSHDKRAEIYPWPQRGPGFDVKVEICNLTLAAYRGQFLSLSTFEDPNQGKNDNKKMQLIFRSKKPKNYTKIRLLDAQNTIAIFSLCRQICHPIRSTTKVRLYFGVSRKRYDLFSEPEQTDTCKQKEQCICRSQNHQRVQLFDTVLILYYDKNTTNV